MKYLIALSLCISGLFLDAAEAKTQSSLSDTVIIHIPNEEPSEISIELPLPKPNATIITPSMVHKQTDKENIFYLTTNQNFCENCLNMISHPQKPLKLFLGRIIITQNPLEIRFEPIKDHLEESDIASKEYLLSHQYYDSLAQADNFYTKEIQKIRDSLQKIDFQDGDTIVEILKKLEPFFHFACKESGETYWNKQWVLDREALLWSGISAQKGGQIPHLNVQLGSCNLKPYPDEIEPLGCNEWRRSIKQYPPLKSCSILGNPLE